jgi:hypothetical protein
VTGDHDGSVPSGVTRREAVATTGGLLTGVGVFRAIDNIFLGYGQAGRGTNLLEQDLVDLVTARLELRLDESIGGTRVRIDDTAVVVSTGDGDSRLALDADERSAARELDARLGLDGRLAALYADARAVRTGEVRFRFSQPAAFFDRLRTGRTRPGVVGAIRGARDRIVAPEIVEAFAGADPARPARVVEALVPAFREHATYDVPRYVAGSIEDNVLFGAADLREHFEDDVSYEAMRATDSDTGMFCYEFVTRSCAALQACSPRDQRVPVATAYVRDARHKHAYTGIASAVRTDGNLVVRMTFVDYTHSTLYDDFNATGLMGRGLAAYDARHRVSHVYW